MQSIENLYWWASHGAKTWPLGHWRKWQNYTMGLWVIVIVTLSDNCNGYEEMMAATLISKDSCCRWVLKFSTKEAADSLTSAGSVPESMSNLWVFLKSTQRLCIVIDFSGSSWSCAVCRLHSHGKGLRVPNFMSDKRYHSHEIRINALLASSMTQDIDFYCLGFLWIHPKR